MIRNLWDEAENSRAATSRVAALRELRKIFESKPKKEEPPPGNPRAHDLAAVLKLAEDAGVDVGAAVPSGPRVPPPRLGVGFAEALLYDEPLAGRDAAADTGTRPDPESKPPEVERPQPVTEAEVRTPSGPPPFAYVEDDGRWVLNPDAEFAADIRRQEFEQMCREGERLVSGWVDPDLPSPLRPNGNEAA